MSDSPLDLDTIHSPMNACCFREHCRRADSDNYKLRAELDRLRKDAARLDWLADVNNTVGQVLLPSAIVETALGGGLRGMIDAAMEMEK
ncbi:hypothetical protein V3390_09440 [Luteimonas sp. FXH3W]|uniref:Uncharacterized protein n=1 Tax=Aquilutibacter rugosus TaxID=3115820 RepID=A0ABU7V2A8_9GAMM